MMRTYNRTQDQDASSLPKTCNYKLRSR
jgi:hypothetical protein